MRTKYFLLIFLEIPLLGTIVVQAWSKAFPVWAYFVVVALLGLVVSVLVLKLAGIHASLLVQLLLVALLAREMYYLSTNFRVMPLGDSYGELGVMRQVLLCGFASTLAKPRAVSLYSGWPAIQILGAMIARIWQVTPLTVAILLPTFLFVAIFVLVWLMTSRFVRELRLPPKTGNIAMLVTATAPFAFMLPYFKYQIMASVLLFCFFYLVYRLCVSSSPAYRLLLVVLSLCLVITHHFTAFVAAVYLTGFCIYLLVRRKRPRMEGDRYRVPWARPVAMFTSLAAVTLLFLFVWWNKFAIVIWPFVDSYVGRFVETVRLGVLQIPEWGPPSYPKVLTPGWAVLLLQVRDVCLLVAMICGFLFIYRVKTRFRVKGLIVYSVFAAAMLFCLTFIASRTFGRQRFLFLPFIVLCIGAFYGRILQWKSILAHVWAAGTLVLFVFCAFVGGSNHQLIPAHYYDPSLSHSEVGDHNPEWRRVGGFLLSHVPLKEGRQYVTDDVYLMRLLLPLEKWDNVHYIETKWPSGSTATSVVSFNHLTKSLVRQANLNEYVGGYNSRRLGTVLAQEYHRSYTDGGFDIWESCQKPKETND